MNMIEVIELKKYFWKRKGFLGFEKEPIKAVDGVSFTVEKGQTFGLVGESGSGKSTIARLLVGILTPDSGYSNIRGKRDIVFQDPSSSLNPRMRVGEIVGEALLVQGAPKWEREQAIREALHMVRLKADNAIRKYPHQFSGGERQRIAIARALIRHPDVLIFDEPIASLDVSIQASIINLLKDLQDEMHLTYLFISHDLRVVEFMSSKVGVIKDGRLVEIASCEEIYTSPKSEYTRQLLESIPEF